MSLRLRLLRWGHRLPLHRLPFHLSVALSSWGRRHLWKLLAERVPATVTTPPPHAARHLWGLCFRAPLFNAAGMFKYGEGYELAYRQGAGAYLAGTATDLPRRGRISAGICQPFASYPRSRAALNALGLPNPGHSALARRIARLPRYPGFPIGVSVAVDPELPPEEALPRLLGGLRQYVDAGVDFIELNESCPNVPHNASWRAVEFRLRWLAEHFLQRRERFVPVVVKVSLDLSPEMLTVLLHLLLYLGYDGITLGNTSTAYEALLPAIAPEEQPAYSHFWQRFGGGISGAPLRERRRELIRLASAWLAQSRPEREFHLIAAGGILCPDDLTAALADGASLAQWYTGYLFALAEHGDALYRHMYAGIPADP